MKGTTMYPREETPLDNTIIADLASITGQENVSQRESDLRAHSEDESWVEPHMPDAVVWPSDAQEISAVLAYANDRQIPVIPWSGGSSLEGNPVPVHGGIVMALYRLNSILDINEDDLQVTVQPGVVYDDLNAKLRRLGLFFPPAPGSSDVATLGGMVANNSSGMHAVKYGVTRNYVLELEVVLPNGDIRRIGSRTKKSTSGYDLVGLFVGSEGTLGVVSEIVLRLMGLPEHVACVVAVYDSLTDAARTVYEAVRYGLDPAAIELLDASTVRVTNEQQGLALREAPTLFVEFHGNEAGVADQLEYLQQMCNDNNCTDVSLANTPESRDELWAARREAYDSIKRSHPGKKMISGDVCVPISKFSEMVQFSHQVGDDTGLSIYVFGHAGDGNLHTEIIVDQANPQEMALGIKATNRIVRHSLAIGGTIAGEHGVGLAKREFLPTEHGESLALMRSIKQLIDPHMIMNPGKIFPNVAEEG